MAELEATETAAEFAALHPSRSSFRDKELIVYSRSGVRLRLVSGHVATHELPNGTTDWANTSRLRVMAIESAR